MADQRKVIKVVSSGAPTIYPSVSVYDSTLEHMAEGGHLEELNRISDVYKTIESPDRVHKSKTHPKGITLINESVTSKSGDPLRVAVKVLSDTEAIMSTAHFSSSTDQGELLWARQDEEQP